MAAFANYISAEWCRRPRGKGEAADQRWRCYLEVCHRSCEGMPGLTCALCENPASSMAWLEPSMQRLMIRCSSDTTVDLCQCGAAWRKRTRLVAWNCMLPPQSLQALCHGLKGICDRTGRPHLILRGKDPCTGADRTKIAQAYPVQFAKEVAKWICLGKDKLELVRLTKLSCS